MTEDNDLRSKLVSFLKSEEERFVADGRTYTRRDAQETLQHLITPVIEVRAVCRNNAGIVAAAPHVSFDHWSEYYCNRAATRFGLGWVVAKHYRDLDNLHIPVSIGRHLNVNRPTESDEPGGRERETARARDAYESYTRALAQASGRPLPLDLLLEFHSHRKSTSVEVATTGIDEPTARDLYQAWENLRQNSADVPEMRIEPVHALRLAAAAAKRQGVLQPSMSRRAFHIEIPRDLRDSDSMRQTGKDQFLSWLEIAFTRLGIPIAN